MKKITHDQMLGFIAATMVSYRLSESINPNQQISWEYDDKKRVLKSEYIVKLNCKSYAGGDTDETLYDNVMDSNTIKIPEELSDEQLFMLISDEIERINGIDID